MNKKIHKVTSAILLMSIPLSASSQCLNIHSWKWWSNEGYIDDRTSGPGIHPETYSYAIGKGAETFLDTVLEGGEGPNGEGRVVLYNGDYGADIVPAYVRTYSNGIECTQLYGSGSWDPGHYCNHTTRRADKANIIFNDFYLNTSIAGQTQRQVTASHEIGHVFGLGHLKNETLCGSFMGEHGWQPTWPLVLNGIEINWINSNYP